MYTLPKLGRASNFRAEKIPTRHIFCLQEFIPGCIGSFQDFPNPFYQKAIIHVLGINHAQTPLVFRPTNCVHFRHVVFKVITGSLTEKIPSNLIQILMSGFWEEVKAHGIVGQIRGEL